jgi:hypothetical protein
MGVAPFLSDRMLGCRLRSYSSAQASRISIAFRPSSPSVSRSHVLQDDMLAVNTGSSAVRVLTAHCRFALHLLARRGVRSALEKVGRKLRFPDDSFKSQTEIHNFRAALAKVVPQLEKPAGIRKSCRALSKVERKLEIPAGNSQSQTAFWISVRLRPKLSGI